MKFVRIKAYQNQKFTGCECAVLGDNVSEALHRFHKYYPVYDDWTCNCVAEVIDDQDERFKEWFKVARRCGVIISG